MNIRKSSLFILCLLVLLLTQICPASSINDKWFIIFSSKTPLGKDIVTFNYLVDFEQKDNILRGELPNDLWRGPGTLLGKIDGANISWTIEWKFGGEETFLGTLVNDNKITGQIKGDQYGNSWEGTAVVLKCEVKNPKDNADMVLIPPGQFTMGSSQEQIDEAINMANKAGYKIDSKWLNCEKPQHKVYLDAYYIYKYEITNEQFDKFISQTGYKAEDNWKKYYLAGMEKYPVVNVTWVDADAYCGWAGGALPTEAQWEKAARGTDSRIFPWGNTWDPNKCNNGNCQKQVKMADFFKGRGTTPVGSFPESASPYGVMDMSGNVWEWCSDWYDAKFRDGKYTDYSEYYKNGSYKNPTGPAEKDSVSPAKILRGGAWISDAGNNINGCRCAARGGSLPGGRAHSYGFRCVIK